MKKRINFPTSRRLGLVAGAAVAAIAVGLVTASPAGAASGSASVGNDTLTVNGTSGADQITLRLAPGAPNTMQVDFGGDGSAEFSFDRTTFSRIEMFGASGNDDFRIDQSGGTFADEAITADGGSGDDVFNGGDGVEVFVGGSGRDFADGNRGNDTGVMGSGDDTFRWDPGDGSDVVEGQTGTDTMDFNGAGAAEVMSLSANGGRTVFLRDLANIRMDMDDVEVLDLTALGGADTITINDMTGTDFREAKVDLGGADAAADSITVNGSAAGDRVDVVTNGGGVDVKGLKTTTRVTGNEPTDSLKVNSLGGNDRVDVGADVAAVIGVTVDLGAGQI